MTTTPPPVHDADFWAKVSAIAAIVAIPITLLIGATEYATSISDTPPTTIIRAEIVPAATVTAEPPAANRARAKCPTQAPATPDIEPDR